MYFSSLRKEERLSLLSFCDTLRPQILVDILVSISKKHPDLPIFNSPDWAASHAPEGQHAPYWNGISQSGVSNGKGKQKTKASPPKKARTDSFQAVDLNEEENPYAVPPSWPQVGHGMYAKLPPESQDVHLLAEENDEAFSHFMVDSEGKQMLIVA
jgi:hypothetical protein